MSLLLRNRAMIGGSLPIDWDDYFNFEKYYGVSDISNSEISITGGLLNSINTFKLGYRFNQVNGGKFTQFNGGFGNNAAGAYLRLSLSDWSSGGGNIDTSGGFTFLFKAKTGASGWSNVWVGFLDKNANRGLAGINSIKRYQIINDDGTEQYFTIPQLIYSANEDYWIIIRYDSATNRTYYNDSRGNSLSNTKLFNPNLNQLGSNTTNNITSIAYKKIYWKSEYIEDINRILNYL
jgi:hypothetical protein